MSNIHLPEDTNVVIPAAVKAAAARSENFFKQPNEGDQPAGQQEAKETQPEEKVVTQEVTEPKQPQPGDWEHRYNSMKGRYDALNNDNRVLRDRLSQLEQTIAGLATQPRKPEGEMRFERERLVTPEEEADYGQDLLAVVGKKAKEELSPEIRAMQAKIEELQGQLAGVGQNMVMSARQKMMDTLTQDLPNWNEINHSSEFKEWLALPDDFTGAIRHHLLKAAWERNDTPRVAAFFRGFLKEAAPGPGTQEGAPAGGTPGSGSKPDLAKFAAPGRAKTAGADAPAEKPIFTRSEIAQFYAEIAAGKWNGRDEAKNKREAQIFAATREGRIKD